MNIADFAKKPELIKITIDQEDIVNKYGSEVTFWIMDSVDISTYFEFFKSQADSDGEKLNEIMRRLILDENGKKVIEDGHVLPVDLALASLTVIGEEMGKLRTKLSTQTTGEQPI